MMRRVPLPWPLHRLPLLLLSSALLLGGGLGSSHAQVRTVITPDGTLGTTVGTTVTPQGRNMYTITGGTRPSNGPNLFHSFDRFSVGTRDIASFQGPSQGPSGIINILSRVTGGQLSEIDGTLQSTIPGANLYLLNPAGVLFGPNARLDISGSFHVSTADYLRLADGARFSARLSDTSTLSVAPPAAFGFLSEQPAGIRIDQSILRVPPGQTLSVVGGDIEIRGAGRFPPDFPNLWAQSGRINLASVASAGEVVPGFAAQGPTLDVSTVRRLGQIRLVQDAFFYASGDGGGGTVLIRSGRLLVDQAFIFVDTGRIDAARTAVDVQVAGDVVVTNGALITADTVGTGNAGDIRITADSVTISGRLDAYNLSRVSSNTLSPDSGAGGSVIITAHTLTMDGGLIQTGSIGSGNAGVIAVTVGNLTLTGGAQLSSSTFASGQGGTVKVIATEALTIAGRNQEGAPSGLFSTSTGSGQGGDIHVEARHLTLSDEGRIATNSTGQGNAGTIHLQVQEQFQSTNSSVTTEATQASGGDILIQAEVVSLKDSRITAAAKGPAGGGSNGGNVTIQAEAIALNRSQVKADASGGQGGTIRIVSGVLLTDTGACLVGAGCSLDASSGVGLPGTVDVRAPETEVRGAVAPLPQTFASAATLLRNRCAARLHEGTVSSLVERGRDGVPAHPGGLLPSRLSAPQAAATTPRAADQRRRKAPVAQQGGLQRDATGQLHIAHWPTAVASAQGQEGECEAR